MSDKTLLLGRDSWTTGVHHIIHMESNNTRRLSSVLIAGELAGK